MNILGIGEIVLDKSYILDSYPAEGEKVQPQKCEYSIGGPVTSASILLTKLGAKCKQISSIGKDETGNKIQTILKSETIKLIPTIQKNTKINTILLNSKNGSRTIIRSTLKFTSIKAIPIKLIKEADLIIFDRHEFQVFEQVLKNKRKETKIIVDPSTEISKKTLKMLIHSDYPIIPIESLKKIQPNKDKMSNLKKLFKLTKKPIIVTAGKMGCIVFDGKKIFINQTFDTKKVDTLGAGDIFRGAFGYGVLNNWSISKIAEFANAAAALQCTRIGNSTAIPEKREIENLVKNGIKSKYSIEQILS